MWRKVGKQRAVALSVVAAMTFAGCASDHDDAVRPTLAPIATAAATAAAPGPGAAPGGSTPTSAPTTTARQTAVTFAPNGTTVKVQALDNSFRVQVLTIVAGTEVQWQNRGHNDHDVLPEGDPQATTWGAGLQSFTPGLTYSHVFDTPGTYNYYCSIHGTNAKGMIGTIIVTAP